jgi:hypothetical protein
MKRSFVFLVGLFLSLQVYSQSGVKIWTENFDAIGSIKVLPDDAENWGTVTDYYVSSLNAYRGIVPNMIGDSIVLETPPLDFTDMDFVEIRFDHICKISARDHLRLEYKVGLRDWTAVPDWTYEGEASNYLLLEGFNASSYSEWLPDDSLAFPQNDWWKEEIFDVSNQVGLNSSVQFRFILKRGSVKGTNIAYGWLLDNLQITSNSFTLRYPTVTFTSNVQDTMYSTGPWDVTANIVTGTTAPLMNPEFVYTAVNEEGIFTDTFLMTNTAGNSWKATIPVFKIGTHVDYYIRAWDANGNQTIAPQSYYIAKYTGDGGTTFDYIYFYPDDTLTGGSNAQNLFYPALRCSWSRHLYMNGELDGVDNLRPQVITDISWYSANATRITPSDIRVYLKATKETTNNTAAWINPDTVAGAVLVYRGQMITGQGWNTLQLQTAFVFPPNHNIMVYFIDSSNVAPGAKSFVRTSNLLKGVQNNAGYSIDPITGGYIAVPVAAAVHFSPLVRFGVGEMGNTGDYSAGLTSIDNPVRETFAAGSNTPIVVTIHNKGVNDLDSVILHWKVNSGNTFKKVVKKELLSDYKMQDTLGYFMSSMGGFDTVTVWLDSQNGLLTDAITYDDTLSTVLYTCDQPIMGWKTVGSGKDFPSIDALFLAFKDCGGGDLIIALNDDVYPALDLSNLSQIMGSHHLTITSISGNAQDVIFRPASGEGIIFNTTNNVSLKAITVDAATSGTYAIRFMGPANNILIRDCRLLADTVSTATGKNVIHKGSDTRLIHNVSFINNLIDGGYYGVYLYGSGASFGGYNTNIIFDSNLVTNSAFMGTYPYCSWFTARYNTIISRSANIYIDPNFGSTSWTGMGMWYANGDHIGNRIIQNNPDIVYPTGIYLNEYSNTSNSGGRNGIIANNEIRLISTQTNANYSAATGISWGASSRADAVNNSIYVKGTGGSRGISVSGASALSVVKNNNIVMESADAYPVYLSSLSNLDVDYNNMYAPMYVGYATSAHFSIPTWQAVVASDRNSVRVQSQFANSSTLEVSNYAAYLCPSSILVDEDINEKTRIITTTMGCYEDIPDLSLNGSLIKVIGLRSGSVSGQSDNLQLVVFNAGSTPLTRFNIGWSINGTSQPAVTANLTNTLNKYYYDTIPLGTITYPAGATNVKIWISSLNPTASVDQNHNDDTLQYSDYNCATGLSRDIEISSTGDYATIEEALYVIRSCGLSGNATLLLDDGVYDGIDLAYISTHFGNYSLTITSLSGDAQDVIIRPTTGVGVLLDNSNNITLRDITVDARTSGSHAIYFRGVYSNITIRDCEIYANPLAADAATACGIYKPSSEASNNITIVNNLIDGGNANIYLYLGNANANMGNNCRIDSNTVQNHFHTGIYLFYGHSVDVSHNTVLRNPATTSTTWHGIRVDNVNGAITANKVHHLGDAVTYTYGIYLNNYNYYGNATGSGLVANNEIIAKTTSNTGALHISEFTRVDVFNNSILVNSPKLGRGIQFATSWYTNPYFTVQVKNNNIVVTGDSLAYPIYVPYADYATVCTFAYNNMYSPNYVGYAGNAKVTMQAWQDVFTTDLYSDTILPSFLDVNTSLQMSLDERLLCPILPQVSTDIEGNSRSNSANMTTMGAYSSYLPTVDLGLLSNVVQTGIVNNSQNMPVYVEAWNLGSTFIDEATFGWNLDGTDMPDYTWTASNPLSPFNQAKIMVGSFPANVGTTYQIKVWINTVNGSTQITTHNDTLSFEVTPQLVDLAWFEEPLVGDTISTLSFEVHTQIIEETGATVNTPQMTIQTIVDNGVVFYDTIEMDYINGYWIASIPQQYYGSKVIYSLSVTDTIGNSITITDSTYITQRGTELYDGYNLSVYSIEKLVADDALCSGVYASVQITVTNTGTLNYDFSVNPITLSVELTTPNPFNRNLLVNTGTLLSGESKLMEITNMLPIATAGLYDVKAWVNSSVDKVAFDDTITIEYLSNKYPLPIDENFSGNAIPVVFKSIAENSSYKWEAIGQDGTVSPTFGTGMLAFSGSRGAMTTLQTEQLDLSRAISPVLSFWYYHDNVPCDDDMDVRLTVDGTTYSRLFALKKYDASLTPGWYEYTMDLPAFAIDQCVVLVFEAMERSDNFVTQYIDRILITAQQELAITAILHSEITSACDLKNKELKVVLSNLTDPILDYAATPLDFTLEFAGTSHIFTITKDTGTVEGFSTDTITVKTGFDFVPGKHILRANIGFGKIYADTININPAFKIEIEKLSNDTTPATAQMVNYQQITITNTGNLELPAMDLLLTVDTVRGKPCYFTTTMTINESLLPDESRTFAFDTAFLVPWSSTYEVDVYGYLMCDGTIDTIASEQEKVNIADLYILDITNPTANATDVAGDEIAVSVVVKNRSIGETYTGVKVGVLVIDTEGETQNFTEEINHIGSAEAFPHTFARKYTVPARDYTLIVYLETRDDYSFNDTMLVELNGAVNILERERVSFTMEQSIPNPAKDNTVINYNIPQDGEIVFHVYSISGQLLYAQKETVFSGNNRIELNLSNYASGIYFYTMEYKGQKLTKRMNVK